MVTVTSCSSFTSATVYQAVWVSSSLSVTESASRDSPLAVTAPIAYPIWFLTPNTRVPPSSTPLGPSVIRALALGAISYVTLYPSKSSSAFSWFNVAEYTFAVLQYPIPTRSEVLAAATLSSGFCSSGLTCVPSDGVAEGIIVTTDSLGSSSSG